MIFDPLSNTLKLLNQARKDAEAEKSSAMPHNMETVSAALMMGEPTQNNMRSNDAITWLRDSAYLEGVEIKIGYRRQTGRYRHTILSRRTYTLKR